MKDEIRRVELKCGNCNRKFSRKKSKVRRGKRHFCSLSCYGQKRNIQVELKCHNCNTKFLRSKSKAVRSKRHFCSSSCFSEKLNSQVKLKCGICGTSFMRKKSNLNKGKHGENFCTRKCKNIAQRHGSGSKVVPAQYTGKWAYRTKALRELGSSCEVCKQFKFEGQIWQKRLDILEVHHIDKDRRNNALNNLMVICPCHHRALTSKLAILENRHFKWKDSL